MPLCSCGVIPAAIGLRRAGASKSATTAFLVSTPETGVDSVSVSYVLLGPFMAIIRPIAAVCSAIVAGVLVGKDSELQQVQNTESDKESTKADPCCSSKQPKPVTTTSCCSKEAPAKPAQSCCSSKESQPIQEQQQSCSTEKAAPIQKSCCSSEQPTKAVESRFSKLKRAVSFSCNKLLEDLCTRIFFKPVGEWHPCYAGGYFNQYSYVYLCNCIDTYSGRFITQWCISGGGACVYVSWAGNQYRNAWCRW